MPGLGVPISSRMKVTGTGTLARKPGQCSGREKRVELPSRLYNNWNPGTEPNNYNGNDEVFAHMYPPGSANAGTWNDELPAFNGAAYCVEFGGMPGDPLVDLYGIVNVKIDDEPPVLTGIFPAGQTEHGSLLQCDTHQDQRQQQLQRSTLITAEARSQ